MPWARRWALLMWLNQLVFTFRVSFDLEIEEGLNVNLIMGKNTSTYVFSGIINFLARISKIGRWTANGKLWNSHFRHCSYEQSANWMVSFSLHCGNFTKVFRNFLSTYIFFSNSLQFILLFSRNSPYFADEKLSPPQKKINKNTRIYQRKATTALNCPYLHTHYSPLSLFGRSATLPSDGKTM